MLNLTELKVVSKAYSKKGNGRPKGGPKQQKFALRFLRAVRKRGDVTDIRSSFIFSDNLFNALDLENKGLIEVYDGTNSGFAVVDEENANFFKTRKTDTGEALNKGKGMISDIVEGHLIASGILDEDFIGNQFLDLQLIEGSQNIEIGGIRTYGVYSIVKGTGEISKIGRKANTNVEDQSPVSASMDSGDNMVESEGAYSLDEDEDDDL